jgi:hypothetical protein
VARKTTTAANVDSQIEKNPPVKKTKNTKSGK